LFSELLDLGVRLLWLLRMPDMLGMRFASFFGDRYMLYFDPAHGSFARQRFCVLVLYI
jgi:hypothetical protein